MHELRAATGDDMDFLFELHRVALGPYVEQTWGWDEEFQLRLFREEFDSSANQVLLVDGRPIGCWRLEHHDDHDFVDYVALIPEQQRRGIGTSLIREAQVEAAKRQVPVRLNVLKANPAKALYERLGFVVIKKDDVRWYMESPRGRVAG